MRTNPMKGGASASPTAAVLRFPIERARKSQWSLFYAWLDRVDARLNAGEFQEAEAVQYALNEARTGRKGGA